MKKNVAIPLLIVLAFAAGYVTNYTPGSGSSEPPTVDTYPSKSDWKRIDQRVHELSVAMREVQITLINNGLLKLISEPTIEP